MKASELKSIISEIVESEIKKQLPSILLGIIAEASNNSNSPSTNVGLSKIKTAISSSAPKALNQGNNTATNTTTNNGNNVAASSIVENKKSYVKDPILNKLLNSTINDLRQKERLVGAGGAMVNFTPDPIVVSNSTDIIEESDSRLPPMETVLTTTPPANMTPAQLTAHKAITRNYSELMAAMNKRTKKP